jgi:hypothetical protein
LSGPIGAEESDEPADQVLRDFIAGPAGAEPVEPTGWRVLARTGGEALYGRGEADYHELVHVERSTSGEWRWAASSCGEAELRVVREGNLASPWRLDPAAGPPKTTSATLHVLVEEIHCASGRSAAGRIEPPDVVLSESAIRIAAYVTPLGGVQRCPGNPATPADFLLPEPMGERALIDAGVYPGKSVRRS